MYKVLIVDDERPIRNGIKKIINWCDYGFTTIDTAANGAEALEMIETTGYDLLITDIRMPLMDGITLIKTLYKKGIGIETIILSGYKEFDYAREALRNGVSEYLLKPVDEGELIRCVKDIKARLDKIKLDKAENHKPHSGEYSLLFDLVRGEMEPGNWEEYFSDGSESAYDVLFCCGLINIETMEQMPMMNMLAITQLNARVHEVVLEVINEYGHCRMYDEVNNVIGLIFYGNKTQLTGDFVESVLSEIHAALHKKLNVQSYITYGKIVQDVKALYQSWEQAKIVRERQILIGDKKIVGFENLHDESVDIWNMSWNDSLLIDSIESKNTFEIGLQVKHLLAEFKEKNFSQVGMHIVLYNLFLDISNVIKNNGGEISECISYAEICENIEKNVDTIREWLTKTIIDIAEYVDILKDNISSGVIFNIQKYIHENYASDITVKSIAAEFYVNASYLGRLFKKTFGVGFNEYLNKYRIAQVKQMLRKKKMKTSEIIEMSGYSTPEYFYRQFKHYEGISFVEYKKQINQKTDDTQ